jgi:hypothetical protein
MAQRHDPHTVEFFLKQQVIGKFFEIGASPAAGIKVETLGMSFHLKAGLLEFRLQIVTERIADRVVVADRGAHVVPDLWVKTQHQRPRSEKTPSRNCVMEIVLTSPDFSCRSLSATSSSETS